MTIALALLALVVHAVPASAQKPKITSLGEEALSIEAKSDQDTAHAYLPVLNAGPKGDVRISFQAASSEKVRLKPNPTVATVRGPDQATGSKSP